MIWAMGLLKFHSMYCFVETSDLTGVVAESVGGSLALVIGIVAIVVIVHRRYTCNISNVSKETS